MARRQFTLPEANAAVYLIRPLIAEIRTIRDRILSRRPELWPAMMRAAGNGGSAELSRLSLEFDRLDQLVHQILDMGAEIKDLGTGLLDFRALRGDREVYLCWQFGEDEIRFWHELDAGYGGRQPIETF
jgi:hypothetical protein